MGVCCHQEHRTHPKVAGRGRHDVLAQVFWHHPAGDEREDDDREHCPPVLTRVIGLRGDQGDSLELQSHEKSAINLGNDVAVGLPPAGPSDLR